MADSKRKTLFNVFVIYDPCLDEHRLRETWIGEYDSIEKCKLVIAACKRFCYAKNMKFIVWKSVFTEELPF